ncbi:PHD finger protein 20 isoform X4 [Malaclemys terrapin pileata]|uniref:PHD finger protein 20 isoform X4 n=1 Tax=Malaclemys terrapin pileata TaxID=2991368 RepID=UPI0023A8F584|nr:PHD finger protein 20 isoform X4 [Malaclemys terrapin pileata]
MTKHPPNRRGINFEVGAQLEARDRLKNWYPAHIEEIDYEEGKVLIHFKRWNHRYDEWFCWDSPYLRPLEKIQLRKEGLHEEDGCGGFRINDQVLACWSDCRFYPAKVTSVNKDGTYTVKFYDGVVQTVKNIHIKAFSKDQNIVGNARPKEKGNEIPSSPEKREKFKEQRKATENAKKDKDEKALKTEKRSKQPDKEGKIIVISEKGKVSEKNIPKNGKEDKENISENDMEYSVDTQIEKKSENDRVKSLPENIKETKRKRGRPPITPPTEQSSQTLQPITLELRRRKIPKGGEVPSKRIRVEKSLSQEKLKNSPDSNERDQIRRRSSRLSSNGSPEIINTDLVTTTFAEIGPLKDPASSPKEPEELQLEIPVESDQNACEQAPQSSGDVSQTTPLDVNISLKEEKVDDRELSFTSTETQEPSITAVKDKEKNKEKKSKDCVRSKSKKKKKKFKSEYPGSEENIDISQELSPPKSVITTRYNSSNRSYPHLSTPLHVSDSGHHRDRVKVNEEDTLSESSTDSLLWSDDDCSQDIDVTTNPDEEFDEEDSDFGIVRCICEVEEENDFMIQCEECLCWQHGVCMGLLEDNVPEKYTCYICQDPPGQRSSLKYWYEKEWLSNGHMHGLAFLEENYSHQNAKKIVATHQLLGDVQKVIEVLHGLQLKMSILQNKEHPDLKLWCHPWKHLTVDEKIHTKHIIHIEENCCKEETVSYRTFNGTVEKPSTIPSVEESYITSEHCYQKPRAYYPAIEQRLVVETRGSAMDDGVSRIRENGDDALSERFGWNLDRELYKLENESKHNYSKVRECVSKKIPSEEAIEMKLLEKDKEGVVNSQLQWQLNLLAHVESLQDEVTHRMDFIEKELDVLESWLDYTGELEPPEPLARLPQLKHCIKQLITDLGKVQQIALCCST